MRLFKLSRLAGRLSQVKLLEGDVIDMRSSDQINIMHRDHFNIVVIKLSGEVMHGKAGAQANRMGAEEFNKRLEYYLRHIGYKPPRWVGGHDFGFVTAVEL